MDMLSCAASIMVPFPRMGIEIPFQMEVTDWNFAP